MAAAVTKRRPSTPDIPSPLRRGVGVGGLPVPVGSAGNGAASVDRVMDPDPDSQLGGLLSLMVVAAKLEPVMNGAIEYVKDRLTKRPRIVVHGREFRQPRNVGFFSDEPIEPYTYSRSSTHTPQPLDGHLATLLGAVNYAVPGARFNAILVNEYVTWDPPITSWRANIGAGMDPRGRSGSTPTTNAGSAKTELLQPCPRASRGRWCSKTAAPRKRWRRCTCTTECSP